MKMPIFDHLVEILAVCERGSEGELADDTPQLAEADPDPFGVCLATVDGPSYAAGDGRGRTFSTVSVSSDTYLLP